MKNTLDDYTFKTKLWLDERFKQVDEYGVYWAHQPIYGFRAGHSEPGLFERYSRTYQIMKSLSRLEFSTLLDVGGAEGYKAYLAREIFGAKVTSSDLSEEACKRAREIFNIEAIPADVHNLPFGNEEFDVVLCSETLEHVRDLDRAVRELLRVSKKAVVITVPHETKEEIEHSADAGMHSHIHAFEPESFSFLKTEGYEVISKKIISRLSMDIASRIIDTDITLQNTETVGPFKKVFLSISNLCVPAANKIFNRGIAAFVMKFDDLLSFRSAPYHALVFTIVKDKSAIVKMKSKKVSAYEIMKFSCPLHYLRPEENSGRICDNLYEDVCLKHMRPASKEQKSFFAGASKNISFFIDRFRLYDGFFEIAGWAHISGKDSENNAVFPVLQSHKRTYICAAIPQFRPDVTAFFQNTNLDNSGFYVRVSTDNLEKGKYRIGIYVDKEGDRGFQFMKNLIVGV